MQRPIKDIGLLVKKRKKEVYEWINGFNTIAIEDLRFNQDSW